MGEGGKQGDRRRKSSGGRYTPPKRTNRPAQPARLQVAIDHALRANKPAHTAPTGTGRVPSLEHLPQEDQTLLRSLSAKIGRGDSTTPEGQILRENAFHEAVSELNDYILGLRAHLDVGFREPDHSDTDNSWARAEPARPSVKRVQSVAYNFLGSPGVRRVSLGIHGQKLIAAFPHFREVVACSIPPCRSLSEHFSAVTVLMADSLVSSLAEAQLDRYRTLGMVMGYRTAGMRWPVDSALRHFAGQGVETFTEQLERVTRGAIEEGVDPSERVSAELLERDGTIYRLMRIAFDRVNDAVGDIKGKSIADARRVLADNDYSTGACPGILPMESVVDGEAGAKRPIAYEYAMTILKHTPPSLLQPAFR